MENPVYVQEQEHVKCNLQSMLLPLCWGQSKHSAQHIIMQYEIKNLERHALVIGGDKTEHRRASPGHVFFITCAGVNKLDTAENPLALG